MAFLDICGAYTGTTGTGTLTLGSAIPTLLTPAGAGAVDATVYDYSIMSGNGTDREVGYGTYTASGTSLTRNYVLSTTGSLLSLTGTSEVRMTPRAASLGDVAGPASSTDNTLPRYHLTTGKIIQGSGIVVDDSNNVSGMGTLACGAITSSGAFSIGTSNVATVGSIELGHASANTLTASGGVLSIEGVAVVNSASSPTLGTITTTGNIELGHASANTLSAASGILSVEGVAQVRVAGAQTLTGGFKATPYSAGTKSSGTYTPLYSDGNFQTATNGGAHTLAPPADDCTIIVQYTNNGSAGTITTSGFSKVSGTPTTVNGDDFFAFITKLNGFSHLSWQALQ